MFVENLEGHSKLGKVVGGGNFEVNHLNMRFPALRLQTTNAPSEGTLRYSLCKTIPETFHSHPSLFG